jgi:polyisoprenoid-binding protein YceI
MKKLSKTILFYSLVFFSFIIISAQESSINIESSNIRWYGEEITGKEHFGDLKFKDGNITIKDNNVVSGKFTVDMTSMSVEDLSGGMKAKLEGHLSSDDFFSTKDHTESKLVITQNTGVTDGVQSLNGTLTIKDIEHPVAFTMTLEGVAAKSDLTFDRSKYNVKFRSGNFFENLGDKLILDDIKLEVSLVMNAK